MSCLLYTHSGKSAASSVVAQTGGKSNLVTENVLSWHHASANPSFVVCSPSTFCCLEMNKAESSGEALLLPFHSFLLFLHFCLFCSPEGSLLFSLTNKICELLKFG